MKRILSMVLVVLMITSILPISVFAATMEDSLDNANFTVIDNDQSTLAPGVTMNELVLHNSSNQRVEMYVTTVDTTLDTVKVMANYMDNQNAVFGMQTLTNQVAALEAKKPEPFKIVAGINASYYNVTTGQPTGAFVMEGIDASASGDSYSFFAVLKDGTYMIGAKGEYSKYKDQMQEAIGGWIHLVKDGEVQSGLDKTTLYPRQTLGLTADGKLIIMTADGSQAPVTVGITIQEQAEIMKELGCVEAIHLDGGNSLTFGAIREGEDEFKTVNKPSGGAERAVSNTLVIVSTAVADGTFDHAVIKSDYEYLAPNSTYTFTAFGVDATNAAAEIPETAVWTLSDSSFGTISNGKFVSNGKLGEVDIQLTDGGKVVGSKTITVVNPTAASFALEETTVPYGKNAAIPVTALYGDFDIYTDATHYSYAVSPATAGTMNGFQFSAANDESVKSAVVTATYKYADDVADTITVKFGKGSEVLFDFEDGDISDWRGTDTINEWIDALNAANPNVAPVYKPGDYSNNTYTQSSTVFLASEENGGKVKNGNYALGFRLNHLNLTNVNSWVYNYLYYTGDVQTLRDVANGKTAVRIGMWVYVPDITNVAFRIARHRTNTATGAKTFGFSYMNSDYDGKKVSYNTNYGVPESGWIYMYYDLTDLADNLVQTTAQYDSTGKHNGVAANVDTYPAFLQLFSGSATDTMDDIVYYIDDITLDFSDVTEDRDAPTISDLEVCFDTANFVALNGQTVNNNLLSFSAKVTDVSGNNNMTGLNYTTAKIYIDGIDVSGKNGFKAANGYISLNDIYLTNGTHSVAFVIFDNQGNETCVTKTINVNGSATNSVITIVGRNEGNNVPKAGSVYYLDIKASDAAEIKEITTTLKLNTANRFEYNNIICAEGVTATVTYDSLDFEVTINLTHDGSLSGDAILASIPVRVWAWDEEATGKTADAQFATGAIPVIDVECETVYGAVTYTDSAFNKYVCGFYGALDVATELDNKTAWHKHSTAAIADMAATCTKVGYNGRTYCEGCSSVIEWGTAVPATGHTYKVVGNKIACDCGDVMKTNGLYNIEGVNYYVLAGELVSGWIAIEEDWYYFDSKTYAGVDGEQYADNGIKFVFDNGLVTTGVWVRNANGLRYWYGPGYYRDTSLEVASCRPYEIDGKTYLFSRQGYMQTGIVFWMYRLLGTTGEILYYDCGDDGVAELLTGPYNGYFYKNGEKEKAYQLIQDADSNYYFISDGHKIVINKTLYLSDKYVNGHTYADGTPLTSGYYTFDAEGKMVVKNGVINGQLYINNVLQKCYKLVKYNGDYYFINDGNKILSNITVYLASRFVTGHVHADGTPMTAGYYTFNAEGKLVAHSSDVDGSKEGVVNGYLYIDGVRQTAYKLVKYNGDYYFINDGHKVAMNTTIYLAERFVNGHTYADGTAMTAGYYTFDSEGKLVVKSGVSNGYLYINGVQQKAYKMVNYDGNYYFVSDGHKVAVNTTIYLASKYVSGCTYADGTAMTAGYYTFDSEGKLVVKNGVVDGYLYINNVQQKAYKMVNCDGNYYFVSDGHKVAMNTTIYLASKYVSGCTYADGTAMTAGYYTFDSEGKLVVKNGVIDGYLYINNVQQKAYQLVGLDGDYYFVSDYHKVVVGKKIWLSSKYVAGKTFPDGALFGEGYYTFDESGKLVY